MAAEQSGRQQFDGQVPDGAVAEEVPREAPARPGQLMGKLGQAQAGGDPGAQPLGANRRAACPELRLADRRTFRMAIAPPPVKILMTVNISSPRRSPGSDERPGAGARPGRAREGRQQNAQAVSASVLSR